MELKTPLCMTSEAASLEARQEPVGAESSEPIVWTRHLLGYCASSMQNVQGLSAREERLAKDLTVLLRGFYRQEGEVQWFDLDLLLTLHRRFHGYSRQEAVNAIRGHHRGGPRFDVFFAADATRSDGFHYNISLQQRLLQNHHGQ